MVAMVNIKKIKTLSDVEDALSGKRTIIFKHSTRCPISAMAQRRFELFAQTCEEEVILCEVDVIAERKLSDEITARTGIVHHSPEVLFIRNGEITGYLTHGEIKEDSLEAGIKP